MTASDAAIKKALSSQDDLTSRREHCSLDGRLLASVGATLGQQIRIRRTSSEYALFTVSERRDEDALDRGFAHAVAFHGFDEQEVLIGGIAPTGLKHEVRSAIEAATVGSGISVRVATPKDRFGGDDPRNIVNRLTVDGLGGLQIEQSLSARRDHGAAIADAVAAVYARRLRRRRPPWQERIIDLMEWIRNAAGRLFGRGSRPSH
jgi:hypothetical protein